MYLIRKGHLASGLASIFMTQVLNYYSHRTNTDIVHKSVMRMDVLRWHKSD